MKNTLLSLLFLMTAGSLCAQNTVTLQINPVTMQGSKQITGLNRLGATVWNGVIRNSSSLTVKVTWEDMQLAFPQVNFLTPAEISAVLTRKQVLNFWTFIYNLFKDAISVGTAFYSPWLLTVQPITAQLDPQLSALQPNVAGLIAAVSTSSFTLAPGDTAIIYMAASKLPNSASHAYVCQMSAEAQPMVQPPALLRPVQATR